MSRRLDPAQFEGWLQGRRVGLFELVAEDGMRVAICNLGARILQLIVPDARGHPRDVVLGYPNLQQVRQGLPSMGAWMGRYANRIAHAQMPWEGQTWHLPANDGPHCLHGGPAGSRHQVFEVLEHQARRLRLAWTFLEAVDGFPGDVELQLCFELTAPGVLCVRHEALPRRRATVLNFTCHPFFNLEGHGQGDVLDHCLQSAADCYLPVDAAQIPTGELRPVAGTPFDFRAGCSLAEALARPQAGQAQAPLPGYDHYFLGPDPTGPEGAPGLRRMATVQAPRSGIGLAVWSDAPGFQLYSGGGLSGQTPAHVGKDACRYGPSSGFCLEPQACPDAPNHPNFPSTRCEPLVPVRGRVDYRFFC